MREKLEDKKHESLPISLGIDPERLEEIRIILEGHLRNSGGTICSLLVNIWNDPTLKDNEELWAIYTISANIAIEKTLSKLGLNV